MDEKIRKEIENRMIKEEQYKRQCAEAERLAEQNRIREEAIRQREADQKRREEELKDYYRGENAREDFYWNKRFK